MVRIPPKISGIFLLACLTVLVSAAVATRPAELESPRESTSATLRKFPYPYQAALAVSTDNHGTPDPQRFVDMHTLLNTTLDTPHGPGLGLEVADSFWFFSANPEISFTYFEGLRPEPSQHAPLFRRYIRAGYIDTLHTYGDFSIPDTFERKHAELALAELRSHSLTVPVWSNHGNEHNIQNIDSRAYAGAVPTSDSYHGDLERQAGFKFYWTTDLIKYVGQDRPLELTEYARLDWSHPLATIKNVVGAYTGPGTIFNANRLLRLVTLPDDRKIYSFVRFNNHPQNIWRGADSHDLDRQLSDKVLNKLIAVRGSTIIYNHLLSQFPFPADDLEALRRLGRHYREGRILVATTSRLLGYLHASTAVEWDVEAGPAGGEIIRIDPKLDDPALGEMTLTRDDLQGLTFYVDDPARTEIYLGERRLTDLRHNPADQTGRQSISIPWKPLHFDVKELGRL